jgi:hypothetical protein
MPSPHPTPLKLARNLLVNRDFNLPKLEMQLVKNCKASQKYKFFLSTGFSETVPCVFSHVACTQRELGIFVDMSAPHNNKTKYYLFNLTT